MTKAELIEAAAKAAKTSKAEAERVFYGLVSAVVAELERGGRVTIAGFGKFEVRDRKARTGRNPKTGKEIKIKARKSPVFKAGKALKALVNGK